eukprot:3282513-Amphidinium_carterae.1
MSPLTRWPKILGRVGYGHIAIRTRNDQQVLWSESEALCCCTMPFGKLPTVQACERRAILIGLERGSTVYTITELCKRWVPDVGRKNTSMVVDAGAAGIVPEAPVVGGKEVFLVPE